jgi:acyl carrier protein
MNELESKLKSLVAQRSLLDIRPDEIPSSCKLIEDLGYNSLRFIELIVDIEREFSIVIDDESVSIDSLTNFSVLRDVIQKLVPDSSSSLTMEVPL